MYVFAFLSAQGSLWRTLLHANSLSCSLVLAGKHEQIPLNVPHLRRIRLPRKRRKLHGKHILRLKNDKKNSGRDIREVSASLVHSAVVICLGLKNISFPNWNFSCVSLKFRLGPRFQGRCLVDVSLFIKTTRQQCFLPGCHP